MRYYPYNLTILGKIYIAEDDGFITNISFKELKAQKEYEAAVELGKKMEDMAVTIYSKAGDGGRLFGSITSKDIAEELKKQHNVEVDKRKITLDEPIRVLGSRFVDIKIHQKVTTRLRVDVKEKQ